MHATEARARADHRPVTVEGVHEPATDAALPAPARLGGATASQLAEHVDETPSLVSYHLRKLSEHGFVTQVNGRSTDGRERWWEVASEEGWGFRDSDFTDTPEGASAVGAVTRGIFDTRVAQYRTYLDQKSAWGRHGMTRPSAQMAPRPHCGRTGRDERRIRGAGAALAGARQGRQDVRRHRGPRARVRAPIRLPLPALTGRIPDSPEPAMPTAKTALPERIAKPAHRDGNVLRWLAAYTASLVGDSVTSSPWAGPPRRPPALSRSASSWPLGRCPAHYSCSAEAWWPTGSTPKSDSRQ